MKHAGGRPTKYKKKYCKLIELFFNTPANRQVLKKEIIKSNGTIEREYATIANKLPTIGAFALSIGVDESTVSEWAKAKTKKGKLKYPEFSLSYKRALTMAENMLVENGLAGLSPPPSFIFVATNYTKMRNKQDIDHTTAGKELPTPIYGSRSTK